MVKKYFGLYAQNVEEGLGINAILQFICYNIVMKKITSAIFVKKVSE